MKLIFNIWREVAKQMELSRSMPVISDEIAKRFPLQTLLIKDLNTEESRLETRFASAHHKTRVPQNLHVELTPTARHALYERGVSHNTVLRLHLPSSDPLVDLLVPHSSDGGSVLLGPLVDESQKLIGFLVFISQAGRVFTQKHAELFELMLPPFCAALSADRRIATLDRERRAYAADRDVLLSKLGRQEIADKVVGADSGLKMVIDQVKQVAPTDAPVLILGETGTGKEVIARRIHQQSSRQSGPILRVNCGAIPPELVDSELFGHERGAFTGAVNHRRGWFERADGGTLFLDELGELPAAAQVRLLRVLQDQVIERVGGQQTVSVDVRIVAATHADLKAMVKAGRFREDLWYRLNIFPIALPPLRERPGDIPALAAHFAWRVGKRLGNLPLAPSPTDLELLLAYHWPGNVRELAAVIERAVILGDTKRLAIAAALGQGGSETNVLPTSTTLPDSNFPTLDQAMAAHIERALSRSNGQIEGPRGAAVLLNINPHTLRARMRKLEIDWRRFRSDG